VLAAAVAFASASTTARAVATGDPQAQALLEKHRVFVGWQFGDGTFRTMRITGDVTDEKGKKISTFVRLYAGLLYNNSSTDLERGGITERTGFTGNIFWATDFNGFTTPIYGDYAKFLASFTVLLQEGTTELPASYSGPKTVDGKPVEVVRVSLKNGDPIDLYVNPSNGSYVRAVIDPDGANDTTYHILSYQDVLLGKKMIASYRVDDGKAVHAATKFEPNVAVSGEDLHPPATTASWSFGKGTPFPFTMKRERMLVDATVNGVKGRFILDTGAFTVFLDDRFADRAGLESLKGTVTSYSLYGEDQNRIRRVKSMTFGDATLQNALVFSHDFQKEDYRGLDAKGYDGLIGFDLFAGAIVKLNVYDSTMAILDPTTDISTENGLPIFVDISQGIPTIPMTLDKTIPVNGVLDTGSPGLLLFGPDLIHKHHLGTLGGCTNIDSLAIGPIVYTGQAACEYGMASDYMLLGFDFLKHFDFVFDYPHGRMLLRPNKN
ncbi:MAG: aspartyl protease family protein, partial [Candidatus Eremiobacteraeota bacterium]|nr:aspartyl protease family protein [Candidatus Eremiobacteraeota bacterium]